MIILGRPAFTYPILAAKHSKFIEEIIISTDDDFIIEYAKKNIKEQETPKPVLMYAKSKVQNEIDIRNSKNNYVIIRLGSVYGYSLDTMRINIMPNLFSKLTSQNGTIKLFSGGKQLKSLVNLIDVARCMKIVEENENINKHK